MGPPQWRDGADGGGLVVDWDLRTSLEGLYAAGGQIFANGDHAYAATTRKICRKKSGGICPGKRRWKRSTAVRSSWKKPGSMRPVRRKSGMDWKELNAGVCRVMQDYCGELKSEETLKIGLKWFDEIEAGEMQLAPAPETLTSFHACWRSSIF